MVAGSQSADLTHRRQSSALGERTIAGAIDARIGKISPGISMKEELTAQDEIKYYKYYGLPYYWAGNEFWRRAMLPRRARSTRCRAEEEAPSSPADETERRRS